MIEISANTKRLLIASFIPNIGKATLWRIASNSDFWRSPDDTLGDIYPELRDLGIKTLRYEIALKKAENQVRIANELGVSIIGFLDKAYPASFRKSSLAPALFWYKGDTDTLSTRMITVIGTRQPTKAGAVIGKRVAHGLASQGLTIVSGLALGIDTLAHEGALDAQGKTIAILPAGIDSIAPKSNTELATRIIEEAGGLLSEFPLESRPFSSNFVVRDSTQAAISAAVVLIQSGLNGGSLHASRAALKMGRKLFVTSPFIADEMNNEMNIQANKVLLGLDRTEITKLLKNSDFEEHLITGMFGKSDYPDIAKFVNDTWKDFTKETGQNRSINS